MFLANEGGKWTYCNILYIFTGEYADIKKRKEVKE